MDIYGFANEIGSLNYSETDFGEENLTIRSELTIS